MYLLGVVPRPRRCHAVVQRNGLGVRVRADDVVEGVDIIVHVVEVSPSLQEQLICALFFAARKGFPNATINDVFIGLSGVLNCTFDDLEKMIDEDAISGDKLEELLNWFDK